MVLGVGIGRPLSDVIVPVAKAKALAAKLATNGAKAKPS